MLTLTEIIMLSLVILSPFRLMEFDYRNNLQPVELLQSLDTIEDRLDSILDIAESYGVDKSNRERYILSLMLGSGRTISGYFSMLPFVDDEEGSDLALTLGDTLSSGILLSLLFFPTFAYSTICNSVTWQVPMIFYFFLPIIKILSKTLRSFNTALRIISNTTSSHLLILLLTAALEIARTEASDKLSLFSIIATILMSALLSFVVVLEIMVSALQGYIFSALILYYTHVNE